MQRLPKLDGVDVVVGSQKERDDGAVSDDGELVMGMGGKCGLDGLSKAMTGLVAGFGAEKERVWVGEEAGHVAFELVAWHLSDVAAVMFMEIIGRFYPNSQNVPHNLPGLYRFRLMARYNERWLMGPNIFSKLPTVNPSYF